MKNKGGFSLIVFLFYLTLNSIIIVCICSTVVKCVLPSLQLCSLYQKQLGLHIALDAFVKEIRTCKIVEWKSIASDSIVWNNGENDIGWRYHKNRLERICGIYKNSSWQKQRISV